MIIEMDPTLSRRVGRISLTPEIIQLTPREREIFLARVEEASSFAGLPKVWQELIKRAEHSLKEGFVLKYGKKST